jgi:hypothetical protein
MIGRHVRTRDVELRFCPVCGVEVARFEGPLGARRFVELPTLALPIEREYRCTEHPMALDLVACPACAPHADDDCICETCDRTGFVTRVDAETWEREHDH